MFDVKHMIAVQRKTVTIVLSVAALLLFAISFFIKNDETKNIMIAMGWGLILATILFGLFKGEFGNKPTMGKIEKRMFGKKEKEVEK